MRADGKPRVLVCVREISTLTEVHRLLTDGGHEVGGHLLGSPEPEHLEQYQLLIVEGDGQGLELCRRLRQRCDENFVPILFVTSDPDPIARLASFEAGADTYLLRPFAPGELLAQVRAFVRIKELHDRLSEKTDEVHRINKRLQQAYEQIDQEMELAQRLQTSFLPQSLPEVPRVRFAVHFALCGRVGGDFYDAFRLDEKHVGLYVADAMGHGVPASLLTVFVKKGVKAKEVFGKQYRLVPPSEVLQRLNKELIDQRLSEHPFITMVYALLNHHEGTLTFARAGHPYPLHVPREGELQLWQQEGLLLGVIDAEFPARTHRLAPGDKVLLYSDGIDSATFDGREPGAPSLLACAERHRGLPIQEFVDRLARDLFGTAERPDDLTLLGLEICDDEGMRQRVLA
jgi:sigma-B regulation protein RsbU (phosphoserine phosphatase)